MDAVDDGAADAGAADVGAADVGASDVGAVYDATIDRYLDQVGTALSPAIEAPADLDLLDHVATLLADDGGASGEGGAGVGAGPVLDAGCGPGRVAARLAGFGLPVVGVDVAAAMLAGARAAHPAIPLGRADLAALPFRDGAFAGVVAWYSVIHTASASLASTVAELARVVGPGGRLLVAFQAGRDEAVHRVDAFGSGLALTSHRHDPDRVAAHLAAADLEVVDRLVRPPAHAHETTPQAFLHARRSRPTRGRGGW